jgi:hypothetical protein
MLNILTNQSVSSHTHGMEKRGLLAQPQKGAGNRRDRPHPEVGVPGPIPPLPAAEHLNGLMANLSLSLSSPPPPPYM